MNKLKIFFLHHLGLMLTMIAGYAGLSASSESDFDACLRLKQAFVRSLHTVSKDDIDSYLTFCNQSFKSILDSCLRAKTSFSFDELNVSRQMYENRNMKQEIKKELLMYQSQEKDRHCNQLRKDLLQGLSSVQNEDNKTAVMQLFRQQIEKCNT